MIQMRLGMQQAPFQKVLSRAVRMQIRNDTAVNLYFEYKNGSNMLPEPLHSSLCNQQKIDPFCRLWCKTNVLHSATGCHERQGAFRPYSFAASAFAECAINMGRIVVCYSVVNGKRKRESLFFRCSSPLRQLRFERRNNKKGTQRICQVAQLSLRIEYQAVLSSFGNWLSWTTDCL